MRHSIRVFSLDLGKFIVLTEAASGFYALTPLIAALAGAKAVLALTRDSRYGSAAEVKQYTMIMRRIQMCRVKFLTIGTVCLYARAQACWRSFLSATKIAKHPALTLEKHSGCRMLSWVDNSMEHQDNEPL